MKYIRTKDGIYGIDQPIQPERELQIKWIDDHFLETSWKTKPCEWEQADTIEELVEFVAVKFEWEDLPSVHSLKELYKKAEEKGWNKNTVFDNHKFLLERSGKTHSVEYIKYAIATDKGLIYVAKMNDKGKLELI